MEKAKAIKLFVDHQGLAKALAVRPQSLYSWPDTLTRRLEDRVLAALLRAGRGDEAAAIVRRL